MTHPMPTDTPREPILSDDELESLWVYGIGETENMKSVRDWFRAKITSGELMVVKTTRLVRSVAHHGEYSTPCLRCELCDAVVDVYHKDGIQEGPRKYCLGCGAKIIE